MITLSKNGNAIVFTFEDSQHYLVGDGVIEVPVNSLALITDDSQMATFKKAASNDIFVSATYAEFGKTKDELISWYKDNCVSAGGGGGTGSGVTSGDVETMIATALEDYPTIEDVSEDLEAYYDKDEIDAGFSSVTSSITAAVSGKADTSAVTAVNDALTAHTANTDIHTTSAEKSAWSAKQDALTAGSGISINNNVISCTVSGGGNANIVEVTQAQYDSLVSGGTVDPDALYVITDATEINVSGYAQSSAVTEEIAAAVSGKTDTSAFTAHTADTTIHTTAQEKSTWSGKQDALVSGTNIKTINNQSLLGSGNIDIQGGGGGISSAQCQTMIEDYCDPKEEVIATALNDLNDRVEDLESGGSSVTIATAITSSSTNSEAAGALATYNAITAATTGVGITVDSTLDTGSTNPVANSAITTAINEKQNKILSTYIVDNITYSTISTSNKKALLISKYNTVNSGTTSSLLEMARINGNGIVGVTTDFQLVETSAITSSVTSASTDSQIPTAKAVYDAIPTGSTGGGATYSAGTNISIDTANTISCTLPITSGTGEYSLSIGNTGYGVSQVSGKYAVSVNGGGSHPNTASGINSFAANIDNQALGEGSFANGYICIANGNYSHSEGYQTKTMNSCEHSQGRYNNSVSASTTFGNSGNTLFSVGNGTANNARHNALEIRQNGDIYCSNGTSDVKLQDYLQVKVVKISQSDYDALVQGGTVDSNTLYIITNVVS